MAKVIPLRAEYQGNKPARRRRGTDMPLVEKARRAVRPFLLAGTPIDTRALGKEIGVSHVTIDMAIAAESARLKALEEAKAAPVDPASLPKSAKAKLDAAMRQLRKRIEQDYAMRVHAIDETVRQRVLKENADYLAMLNEKQEQLRRDEEWHRFVVNNHKPPLTVDEFMLLHLCLRGNASQEKLHQAGLILNTKRAILTGEKPKR